MNYKLSFRGDSVTLFKIWITNLLLIICTLGIYYPWARANMKKYLYSSTYLGDYSFEFHGTGKQMFFGLLRFLLVVVILFAILAVIYSFLPEGPITQLFDILVYIPYVPILALFIHGARKFGMSRTSYRSIRFGYRGEKKALVLLMAKGAILTLCSLGIYYPWFINNMREYIYGNTKFGDVNGKFSGCGSKYFGIVIPGFLLTYITLGVYYFWFKKNLFNFFYENLYFGKEENAIRIKSNATGRKFLNLILGNWLIVLFTFGLGYPIAKVRSMRFIAENLELYGDIDLDSVIQTEGSYLNATGDAGTDMDSAGDFFDMDLF